MRAKARRWTTQYRARRLARSKNDLTLSGHDVDELRLILNNTLDMIWRLDANGVIRYLTPSVQQILGYLPDRFLGTRPADWFSRMYPEHMPTLRQLFDLNPSMEPVLVDQQYQLRHADGHAVWIETVRRSVFNAAGEFDGAILVSRDISERKRTEIALQESELRYRTLMNAMAEGILLTDRNGTILACNTAAETIFRTAGEQMIGANRQDMKWQLIDTDGRSLDIDQSPTLHTLSTGIPHQNVIHGIKHPDRVIWISLNTQPLILPGETTPYAAVTSFSDITHLREVEIALREKQAEFEALIKEYERTRAIELEQRRLAEALTKTGVALAGTLDLEEVLDRILTHIAEVMPHDTAEIMLIENGFTYVVRSKGYQTSGAALEMLTLRRQVDQIPNLRTMAETGKPLLVDDRLTWPQWIAHPLTAWVRSFLGAPIQIDGQTIGFLNLSSATPHRFTPAHAGQLAVFATQASIAIRNAQLYNELEQRVQARTAELDLARRHLEAILDATGEGIIYAEGVEIRYVNQMLCRLTGYSEDELVGQSLQLLDSTPASANRQRWLQRIEAALRRGDVWRDEDLMRRKDGSELDTGVTFSLVGDPDDKPLRSVIVIRDISQEKALQAQKVRFVAHASHELRTPIANLMTRLYLMHRQPEHMERHIAVLEEVTARMRRLVEDMLEVSRFERGVISLRPEMIALHDVLLNVMTLQKDEANANHVTLDLDLPATALVIHADAERIHQVFTNLLLNAIFYSHEGGHVMVQVHAEMEGAAPQAVVVVQDSGVGIAPTHLPHLFEPFYRAGDEKGGTGLGLTIAKQIVELHGGSIQVESAPQVGSRFTVRLPAQPPTDTH